MHCVPVGSSAALGAVPIRQGIPQLKHHVKGDGFHMGENSKATFDTKYVSLALSILAICMSVYTFWKSEIYRPPLTFTMGESLNIGHYKEGNAHVLAPVVIINRRNQSQVVERLALKILHPNGVNKHLFEPYYYQRVTKDGNFETESNPIPISVDRNGMGVKNVLFRSSLQNPFVFLEPGVYRVSILSWTQESDQPMESKVFEFNLSQSDIISMGSARSTSSGDTIRVLLKRYEAWPAGSLN